MSTQNLFGQYYTNKMDKNKNKYQKYEYICSNADDGTNNAVVIDDSKVSLVDPNGNELASLDLGGVKAQPVLEHKVGSFILRPYEVRKIEGLERGKTFKKMYFIVPEEIVANYLEDWRYFINVEFDIVYESGLDTKEFNITTVYNEQSREDIVARIQFLIDQLGLKDYIKIDIETSFDYIGGSEVDYITFVSLKEGYDFLVSEFKIHALEYAYQVDEDGNRVRYDLNPDKDDEIYGKGYEELGEDISNAEDRVVLKDGIVFREGEPEVFLGKYESEEDNGSKVYAKMNAEIEKKSQLYGFDATDVDDGDKVVFIIREKDYDIIRSRTFEVGSEKYPNGAARVWFVVPEYPNGSDEQKLSIKLNHIKDRIFDFVPVATKSVLPDDMDSSISDSSVFEDCTEYLYEKRMLDVCSDIRDERERRVLSYFKEYMMCYEYSYMDSSNGAISPVAYESPEGQICPLRYSKYNPHCGFWGYIDHIQMHNEWIRIGQMYGLVTEEEDYDCPCSKNLENSVLLFNPNEFPVKINYFVAS